MEYLPFLVAIMVVFTIYHIRLNRKFFQWVKLHWFYNIKKRQKIASFFYLVGMAGLLLSLLDLRGKELKMKSNIPDQKTIILIDSSSSMLTEDVRPNRFQKAILLARHFVKEAPGNQVAVMLFSDYHKSFVPFTNDIDLLDARISGLATLNITKGGSNLSQALQESIQYFIDTQGDEKKMTGNILVLSDAEETEGGFSLKIPDGISVALVGIGTAKGGPIPLRDARNTFYGNKMFKGQEVISKLDEGFMRSLSSKIKNYKFWVASSFSLPTKEILDFFTQEHEKKFSQGDVNIRPVLTEWILIPSLLILMFAYFLRMQRTFTVALFLFMSLAVNIPLGFTQDNQEQEKPELEKVELDLMNKISNGKASREEKLKLADLLMRKTYFEHAKILYEENLKGLKDLESTPIQINYATTLLKLEQKEAGLSLYYEIEKYLEEVDHKEKEKWLETMHVNTLLMFKSNQNKKNKQNQDQKDQQQKDQDQQEQKENSQGGKGNQQDKPREKLNKPNDKNEKEKEKDKEKNKYKNKDKGDKKDDKDKNDEQADKDKEEQEKKEREQVKHNMKKKLPAQLKQLMNTDRALQEKMLDTSTHEQFKGRDIKDW